MIDRETRPPECPTKRCQYLVMPYCIDINCESLLKSAFNINHWYHIKSNINDSVLSEVNQYTWWNKMQSRVLSVWLVHVLLFVNTSHSGMLIHSTEIAIFRAKHMQCVSAADVRPHESPGYDINWVNLPAVFRKLTQVWFLHDTLAI